MENENIILSSHSVSSVLSMVLIGAKGKTARELRDVLSLPCGGDIKEAKEMYFKAYKSAHEKLQVGCLAYVFISLCYKYCSIKRTGLDCPLTSLLNVPDNLNFCAPKVKRPVSIIRPV